MKLFATCLVRNEDDIITQSLTHAAKYCDRIVVVDNHSTDQTWALVQSLAASLPQILPLQNIDGIFHNYLRGVAYNHFHHTLTNDDWWLILDADEFLAEDPRPAIEAANLEQAEIIRAWFLQYYFTELDMLAWESGQDHRDKPIEERRHYYLRNWQEYRLFRNRTDLSWNQTPAGGAYFPAGLKRVARKRVLIRHYQYRDPPQIYKRIETRLANNPFFVRWRMSRKSRNHFELTDVMRSSKSLQMDLEKPRWGLTARSVSYYYYRYSYTKVRRTLVRLFYRAARIFRRKERNR